MHRESVDRYSSLGSPIHRLDPRAKVVCCFAFIIAVALTPAAAAAIYSVYAAIIFLVIVVSRLPFSFVLKRSLVIIPFVAVIGLFNLFHKPLDVFLWLLVRSWISILAIIIMAGTTELPSLLKALEALGMPPLITSVLSFMYRYIFVLIDRVGMMDKARTARSYGQKGLGQMKAMGGILGSLFIGTYERGERIYLAMQARGYHGHAHVIRPFKLSLTDILASAVFIVVLAATLLAGFLIW